MSSGARCLFMHLSKKITSQCSLIKKKKKNNNNLPARTKKGQELTSASKITRTLAHRENNKIKKWLKINIRVN